MGKVSIYGYCDRLSAAPGDHVRFKVSCEGTDSYRADIVRLIHGKTTAEPPGFKEELIESAVNGHYRGRYQPIHAGSHILVANSERLFSPGDSLALHAFIMPTTPGKARQGIVTQWAVKRQAGFALVLDDGGRLTLWLGDGSGKLARVRAEAPMLSGVWYSVGASYDSASGRASLFQEPLVNATNGRLGRLYPMNSSAFVEAEVGKVSVGGAEVPLVIAGYSEAAPSGGNVVSGHYNGKIDRPRIYRRALGRDEMVTLTGGGEPSSGGPLAAWDFADGIGPRGITTDRVTDVSGNGLHGECVNMPARGMTGHNWTAQEENFTQAPEQYGAIHFHDDDLEDPGWETDFELVIPDTTKSDVYAARVRGDGAEDYIPFFVRPPKGSATAKIVFLAPTASYAAYANQRMAFDGQVVQAIVGRTPVLNEHDLYLGEHLELGPSTYDLHSDSSGVCYSSLRRPVLNMRPNYRWGMTGSAWGLGADLDLIDWLNAKGFHYDVVTDDDLHREGVELLRRYKVVLTGTHPEYYSEAMLDGLEDFVQGGGRLMYMGGNGFYWITSYHPSKPHVIEVRRAEGGSRAWQARPGEYYHNTTGERGGLWRNRGRPPQKLVGVGFSAQGFDVSSYYVRMPDSFEPKVRFIFEGVGDIELVGNFGLIGGGAAGHELDRYDLSLGTPPNTLLLASSEGYSDNYIHVVEEIPFMTPGAGGTQDFGVRADMVYFPTGNGGAVFSVSSIAWCGSLSHNRYDNNVSRITANVLTRFAHDEPMPSE